MSSDEVVYVEGRPMLQSDRNMQPPWRVYPDDLVGAWAEAVSAGPGADEPMTILMENKMIVFIEELSTRSDFDVRVSSPELLDLLMSLRHRGYAVGHDPCRLTADGSRRYRERMKDMEKIRPNAAAALRHQVRLVAY